MTNQFKHTNSLINSGSPYLLQHAHNPVNWREWNESAWEDAKRQNKPVIVSIGYSACHWCHVMEHESFEDEETAELMNKWFINIKVDREERPDVDMVYMDACQIMTGKGGWPLNVICLPDGRPIYAGTYFPRESWQQILLQIYTLWTSDIQKAYEYADKVSQGMQQLSLIETLPSEKFSRQQLHEMVENMEQGWDFENGGQNRAPKFPMTNNYQFLLDYYLLSQNKQILDFINLTLLKMRNGGIYDQIRGGFCRYSTDAVWLAPHFEKMLYDNAQLIGLYARAAAITKAPIYEEVVKQSIDFCNRELRDSSGAFYSALDADSEGIEGRFYVFTYSELKELLTPEELTLASIVFNAKEDGNWEHSYNIIHQAKAPLQAIEAAGITADEYVRTIESIRSKLFQAQEKRERPGLDNKILTAWNALMVKGLCEAGLYLNKQEWINQAEELSEWIWNSVQCEGQLWRVYVKNAASIPAFAEDYAALADAYNTLFECTGNSIWANRAKLLIQTLIRDFYDYESGLFYFTSKTGEQLAVRKMDISDDVISSANSILSIAMHKNAIYHSNTTISEMAQNMIKSARQQIIKYPAWYSTWAQAAQAEAIGMIQVECTGPNAMKNARNIKRDLPSWALVAASDGNDSLEFMKNKTKENQDLIYICIGETCMQPVNSIEQAMEILEDFLTI